MQRYFPIPFVTFLTVTSVYTIINIIQGKLLISWLGTAFISLPMLGFFIALYIVNMPRSSRHLPIQMGFMMIGLAISLIFYTEPTPLMLSIFSSLFSIYYIRVYTSLDRSSSKLSISHPLPYFKLQNIQGGHVSSIESHGRYRLWLFIRANWCPLCVAQVKELTSSYQILNNLNCDIYIISSQPEKASQQLAKTMQAPLTFLIDKNNAAAKVLGIEHLNGTPFGMPGYNAETAMPTAIITAPDNTVILADLTDNYRLRPEPDTFIKTVQKHAML